MRDILLQARSNPAMWKSDFCDDLCEFYNFAVSHPTRFPVNMDDSPLPDKQTPDPSVDTSNPPLLTTGFISALAAKEIMMEEKYKEPVLRVVGLTIGYEETDGSVHQAAKRARVLLWDGGEHVVLGVIAGHLIGFVEQHLDGGQPIIRLKTHIDSVYQDIAGSAAVRDSSTRPCLLIVHYQFLCRPIKDIDATKFDEIVVDSGKKGGNVDVDEVIGEPESNFHKRILNFQKNTDTEPLPVSSVVFCKAPHFLCSRYGQRQYSCVAERFESLVGTDDFLKGAFWHCYFVDRPVEKMDNSKRRNLLYYWFVTNIYFIRGSKNRKELPECLLCLIRMSYPNAKNVPYTGFKKFVRK